MTSRKIPVTERQFLWVQDDDKEVGTILSEVLGGTKLMPTVRALIEKFGTPSLAAPTNGGATAKPA